MSSFCWFPSWTSPMMDLSPSTCSFLPDHFPPFSSVISSFSSLHCFFARPWVRKMSVDLNLWKVWINSYFFLLSWLLSIQATFSFVIFTFAYYFSYKLFTVSASQYSLNILWISVLSSAHLYIWLVPLAALIACTVDFLHFFSLCCFFSFSLLAFSLWYLQHAFPLRLLSVSANFEPFGLVNFFFVISFLFFCCILMAFISFIYTFFQLFNLLYDLFSYLFPVCSFSLWSSVVSHAGLSWLQQYEHRSITYT